MTGNSLGTKDSNNNCAVGNVKRYDCANCVIHVKNANKLVLQGLDGCIVSEKKGLILVIKRNVEQRIRYFQQIK